MSSIAERLEDLRARVDRACARAGRDAASVVLIGVSKRQPAERLRAAYDAGLRVFGESYVQEAIEKAEALPGDIDWHLIAPMQSNKVKKAAPVFSTFHAVDRMKIARLLDREAAELGRELDVFLEVNLADESTKHGFSPAEVIAAAAELRELEHLRFRGLMAIPPPRNATEDAREDFRRLRALGEALGTPPAGGWALSMGMSDDFEIAIEEGATHVRVGTALFGPRPH